MINSSVKWKESLQFIHWCYMITVINTDYCDYDSESSTVDDYSDYDD